MPETETLTLTDFLLARLAEDEERLPKYHDGMCEAMMRGDRDPDAECDCGLAAARRFQLADVEAKHRLFDLAYGAPSPIGERVMLLLALPYADHPAYREEWKP